MRVAGDVHAPLFLCRALEQATDVTYATYGTYVTEPHESHVSARSHSVRAAADALHPPDIYPPRSRRLTTT